MKLTYKVRLFGSILVLFALFGFCLIISEQREQKTYKSLLLESKLDGYVEAIHAYILKNNIGDGVSSLIDLHELVSILPADIRLTIISESGNVFFDNDITAVGNLENHLSRPEILKAQYQNYGSNVRMSSSTHHEYMYYAKFYSPYFIRVALPYTIETQSSLKADNWFIYVVIVLFSIILLLVNFVANRFEKSISKLRDFTKIIKDDKPMPNAPIFPDDELGDIGRDLVDILKQKEDVKHQISAEHRKLAQHFQYAEIGLCLFDKDYKKILTNTYFMQYLNLILNRPTFDVSVIFDDVSFVPVKDFIQDSTKTEKYKFFTIEKNSKVFFIQVIVFEDGNFEVTIKNITKIEKNRLLKQEMTNNVAHELRTPVTSLRGYLETLTTHDLPEDKKKQFIDRAYQQILRLSALIEDVSLLSNIEEAPERYAMETIDIAQLVNEVRIDLSDKLSEQSITLKTSLDQNETVKGNYTLLYSIFRNLMENTINYAGANIEIHINNYLEDDEYLYISYYDTGIGVPNDFLNRLFERFYRGHEGRTRNTGGSGLGLSIVKNAILLHKGKIEAKNRETGGLEFLFTLKKV